MIDGMTMDMMQAPKPKEVNSANKRQDKTSKTDKKDDNKTEFKDLVKEYAETSKSKETKKTKKAETSEKVDTKENPKEDTSEAEQAIMQLLVDVLSFSKQEAEQICGDIMSKGGSEQLEAIIPMLTEDKQAQISQVLQMASSNKESSLDQIVPLAEKLVSQSTDFAKDMKDSQQSFAKTQNAPKENIQQSQQAKVENNVQSKPSDLHVQAEFKSAVTKAKALLNQNPQEKQTESKVDVDKLQQQADSFKLAGGIRYAAATANTQGISEKELQESVASQVKTGIVENLHTAKGIAKNEFVIKLKPEGLGEITVTMSQTGKDISLNILTQKAETQKLLNADILQLKEALKPYNAQIEQVTSKTDVNYGSFANGSEQFFGRNGSWQSGGNQSHHYYGEDFVEEDISQQEQQDSLEEEVRYA